MHQAVSTGWLVAGMVYTQLSFAQAPNMDDLPQFDWQTPHGLAMLDEELVQQAELPPSPTAFSIQAWPDIYSHRDPHYTASPSPLELDASFIQPHSAPDIFRPHQSATIFYPQSLHSTRTLLANKDLWPTFVVTEEQKNWVDSTREYLHTSATGPVVWFDNFFAVNRGPKAATHDLRIAPIMECSDLEGCEFKLKVRSRVTMPNTEKRLRLLLTNEDPNSVYDTLDRRVAAGGADKEDRNPITAALSWALATTDDYNISISSGLQLRTPVRAFVQASSTGRMDLTEKLLLSAGQSVFYRSDEGLGARTQIDLDHSLRDSVQEVLRWRQMYDVSDEFSGIDWKTSLEYLRQVNRDRAWGLGYGNSGNIDHSTIGEAHKVWFRYRKRFYREWLFWELEPFVQWKREFGFKADPGIEASIEIYLDKES